MIEFFFQATGYILILLFLAAIALSGTLVIRKGYRVLHKRFGLADWSP